MAQNHHESITMHFLQYYDSIDETHCHALEPKHNPDAAEQSSATNPDLQHQWNKQHQQDSARSAEQKDPVVQTIRTAADSQEQICQLRSSLTVFSHIQRAVQRWGFKFSLKGTAVGATSSEGVAQMDVSAVPVICMRRLQAQDILQFMALESTTGVFTAPDLPQPVQNILQSVACRSAIMFGDTLAPDPMCQVLEDLQCTRTPFHCAHGRPTTAPLADVGLIQQKSVARQEANWMKAGSVPGRGASAGSMKHRLERQLSQCPSLDLTLCLARDFMM